MISVDLTRKTILTLPLFCIFEYKPKSVCFLYLNSYLILSRQLRLACLVLLPAGFAFSRGAKLPLDNYVVFCTEIYYSKIIAVTFFVTVSRVMDQQSFSTWVTYFINIFATDFIMFSESVTLLQIVTCLTSVIVSVQCWYANCTHALTLIRTFAGIQTVKLSKGHAPNLNKNVRRERFLIVAL